MKILELMHIGNSLEGADQKIYNDSLDKLILNAKRTIVNNITSRQKYQTLKSSEVISYVRVINKNVQIAKKNIKFDDNNSKLATKQFIELIMEVVER